GLAMPPVVQPPRGALQDALERLEVRRVREVDLGGRPPGCSTRLIFQIRVERARASKLVAAYGHGLPQVHGRTIRAGGNADQGVAVTQLLGRKPGLLRSKEQRGPLGRVRGAASVAPKPAREFVERD